MKNSTLIPVSWKKSNPELREIYRQGYWDKCDGKGIPGEYETWRRSMQASYEKGRLLAAFVIASGKAFVWGENVLAPRWLKEQQRANKLSNPKGA